MATYVWHLHEESGSNTSYYFLVPPEQLNHERFRRLQRVIVGIIGLESSSSVRWCPTFVKVTWKSGKSLPRRHRDKTAAELATELDKRVLPKLSAIFETENRIKLPVLNEGSLLEIQRNLEVDWRLDQPLNY